MVTTPGPWTTSFVDHLFVISVLVLLCFCARLFIDVLWSSARKGLTSWLSLMMFNCEVNTFWLECWFRCGAWLYRFLIFALFLTLLPSYAIQCTNMNQTFIKPYTPSVLLWGIGKQYRPDPDQTLRSAVSSLFAYIMFYQNLNKNQKKVPPNIP